MKRTVPHGDEDLICPMHKKSCDAVCHECPWWQQVRGKNSNTGQDVDEWSCAVALLPMLIIEAAQQARQGAAATESLRNEMVTVASAQQQTFAGGVVQAAEAATRQMLRCLIQNDGAKYIGASYETVELNSEKNTT